MCVSLFSGPNTTFGVQIARWPTQGWSHVGGTSPISRPQTSRARISAQNSSKVARIGARRMVKNSNLGSVAHSKGPPNVVYSTNSRRRSSTLRSSKSGFWGFLEPIPIQNPISGHPAVVIPIANVSFCAGDHQEFSQNLASCGLESVL